MNYNISVTMCRIVFSFFLGLVVGCGYVSAQTVFTSGFLKFQVTGSDEVAVKGPSADQITGLTTPITIPATVEYGDQTYRVTSIMPYAFQYRYDITVVAEFPATLKSIGTYAFNGGGANLAGDLILGEGLESIAEYAFQNCSKVTSIELPSKLATIGKSAFYGMNGLRKVTLRSRCLPDGDNGFHVKTGEETLDIIIGSEVERIPKGFFSYTTHAQLTFEEGSKCREIGESAFYSTGLQHRVMLPESLETIGYKSFSYITTPFSIAFSGERLKLVTSCAFEGSTGLEGNLELPASVKEIATCAFYDCSGLNGTILLPDSLTMLGSKAFMGCSKVTAVHFCAENMPDVTKSDVLKNLGAESDGFSVVIGRQVKRIPSKLFSSTLASSLRFEDGSQCGEIAASAFRGTQLTGSLSFPASLKTIGARAFENVTLLTDLRLDENIEELGDGAFYGCTGLKTLYYNTPFNGYTNDRRASQFYNVGKESGELVLTIGRSIQKVYARAFSPAYPSRLVFEEESRCEEIEAGTFSGKDLGGDLIFPASMKRLGNNAFYGTLIGSVSLTENIEEIGSAAFASCSRLNKVEWNVPAIATNESLFRCSGGSQGFVLVLGNAVRLLPDGLFESEDIEDIEIEGFRHPEGKGIKQIVWPEDSHIDSIGRFTFAFNTLLAEASIPCSVRGIGNNAFCGCSGLGNVSLSAGVEFLGRSVFAECPNLAQVDYDVPAANAAGLFTLMDEEAEDADTYFKLILGPNVRRIADWEFSGARIDTLVMHADSKLESIGRSAFESCSNMKAQLHFAEGLKVIGRSAFEGCKSLSASLSLPASLEEIGQHAFSGVCVDELYLNLPFPMQQNMVSNYWEGLICNGRVTIGKDVTEIASDLFSRSPFTVTSLLFEEGSHLLSIGEKAFCKVITGGVFSLPSTVKTIGKYAFEDAAFTGKMVLPEALEDVGSAAFRGCSGLTGSLAFPATLAKVGDESFKDCRGLGGQLLIPASVQEIGWDAFAGTGFTGLLIEEGETPLKFGDNFNAQGGWVIKAPAYPSQQRVAVMSGVALAEGQFAKMPLEEAVVNRDCDYLCGAMMDMGVSRHYYSPFCGSSTLRRLEIGNQVTVLKAYQFSRCNALNEVVLPVGSTSLTQIDKGVFNCDSALVNINIPASVTSIGEYCFAGCPLLEKVEVGSWRMPSSRVETADGGITIGERAFGVCDRLSAVVLGLDVKAVKAYAFSDCPMLTVMTCMSAQPPVADCKAFSDTDTHICRLRVPEGSGMLYAADSVWKEFLVEEHDLTGVHQMLPDPNADEVESYDLNGRRLTVPVKGINLVRMSDGSVRKVFVKPAE